MFAPAMSLCMFTPTNVLFFFFLPSVFFKTSGVIISWALQILYSQDVDLSVPVMTERGEWQLTE